MLRGADEAGSPEVRRPLDRKRGVWGKGVVGREEADCRQCPSKKHT